MIIISPCNERSFAQRNFKPLYLSEFNFGQRFHPPYMIMNYFVALFFFSPSFFFFHFKSWPTLAELKDNCSHLWKKFKVVFCGRAKSHSHVRLLFSWEEWGEGRSGEGLVTASCRNAFALRKLYPKYLPSPPTQISPSPLAYFTISYLRFHALFVYICIYTRTARRLCARSNTPDICLFCSLARTLLDLVQGEREVKFLSRECFRPDMMSYIISSFLKNVCVYF